METFFALLAICERNLLVTAGFPSQRPVMWSFDVFFDLNLNKWLSKQSRCQWFEMPLLPLWCHCNTLVKNFVIVANFYFYNCEFNILVYGSIKIDCLPFLFTTHKSCLMKVCHIFDFCEISKFELLAKILHCKIWHSIFTTVTEQRIFSDYITIRHF